MMHEMLLPKRELRVVAMMVALGLGMAACGNNASDYVINKQAQLYFKVPSHWRTAQVAGDSLSTSPLLHSGTWAEFFGPPEVEPQTVTASTSPGPIGILLIGEIEQSDFDSLTMKTLRSIPVLDTSGQATQIDPIDIVNSQDDDTLGISTFQEIMHDGLRGFRLRFVARPDSNSPYVVYDEIKLVYDATHTFYQFQVACSTNCYLAYRQQINSMFTSLRVHQDQP